MYSTHYIYVYIHDTMHVNLVGNISTCKPNGKSSTEDILLSRSLSIPAKRLYTDSFPHGEKHVFSLLLLILSIFSCKQNLISHSHTHHPPTTASAAATTCKRFYHSNIYNYSFVSLHSPFYVYLRTFCIKIFGSSWYLLAMSSLQTSKFTRWVNQVQE